MNTKQLRQKILDLAIRGKLVPQDPNDEPASVLLERIKAEKERLIKEGKIKRPKKSATTADKPHYPFDLPNGWVWTNIGELLVLRDAERIPVSSAIRSKQTNKIYPYYGAAGVIDYVEDYIFDEKLLLIGEDGANLLSKSKDNAFFAEGKYWVNNHAHILDCPIKLVLRLAALTINAINLDPYITGSAQPKLSQDNLVKILIALPPLNEQFRIFKAIELYEDLLSSINHTGNEISTLIKKCKSRILHLAISGKLVPQDPADEPAEELLRRINPSAVPADKSHYQHLPNGWCLTSMNYICQIYDGERQTGDKINLDAKFLRGRSEGTNLNSGRFVPKNTTMILVDGENSGEIFTAPIDGYQGSTFKLLNISDEMNVEYVKIIIRIYQKRLRDNKVGSAIPHLNKKMFKAIEVPVPPINEQSRIAEKVFTLFSHIDALTEFL